jgi:peroxiredoxin (alkyl hydroperoxide reductase subunit C)
MSLVGKQFPNITIKAMDEMGDTLEINVLDEAVKNKQKVLLFWYPKDFTFVCPTEIHAFQSKLEEFANRGCKVIGASCDSAEVHFAWLTTPKENGGIEGVTFPLLADTTRQLSQSLNILDMEYDYDGYMQMGQVKGDNVTYRATYLIDENGIIFHESVNDMPIGRNVDEYLRLLDAKIHNEKHGEVCPANWEEGKDAMNATKDGVANYLSTH